MPRYLFRADCNESSYSFRASAGLLAASSMSPSSSRIGPGSALNHVACRDGCERRVAGQDGSSRISVRGCLLLSECDASFDPTLRLVILRPLQVGIHHEIERVSIALGNR